MTDQERKAAEMALEALEAINEMSKPPMSIALAAEIDGAMEALRQALAQPEQTHTDHPARHWDRTCPACAAQPWDTSDMAHRPGGLSVEEQA